MRRLGKKITQFLRGADGPAAVEYAVVIAMVLLICISSVQSMGALIGGSFTRVDGSLEGNTGSITERHDKPVRKDGAKRATKLRSVRTPER